MLEKCIIINVGAKWYEQTENDIWNSTHDLTIKDLRNTTNLSTIHFKYVENTLGHREGRSILCIKSNLELIFAKEFESFIQYLRHIS